MRFIGIKPGPRQIRYAILSMSGDGDVQFVNSDSENRLKFPADLTEETGGRIAWLYMELERIFTQLGPFDGMTIKISEFAGSEKQERRMNSYYESIALLVATRNGVPHSRVLYLQLGTKRNNALALAEAKIGRTAVNWDVQMADAVLAAASNLN